MRGKMLLKIIKVQDGILFAIAADGKSGLLADYNDQPELNWHDATEGLENGWRLPTRSELNLLHDQRDVVGGFANVNYWSSSEDDSGNAWLQSFNYSVQCSTSKFNTCKVRAVKDVKLNIEVIK